MTKTFSHFYEELKEFVGSDETNQRLVPGPVTSGGRYNLGSNSSSRGESVQRIRSNYKKVGTIDNYDYYLSYEGPPSSSRYGAVINNDDETLDFTWTLPGGGRAHSSLFPRINERLRGQRKGAMFAANFFKLHAPLVVMGTNDQSQGARKMWRNMADNGGVPFYYCIRESYRSDPQNPNLFYGFLRGDGIKEKFERIYATSEYQIRVVASGHQIKHYENYEHSDRFDLPKTAGGGDGVGDIKPSERGRSIIRRWPARFFGNKDQPAPAPAE